MQADNFASGFISALLQGNISVTAVSILTENEDDVLNCGIDIRVQPPTSNTRCYLAAFTAIAILFAILKINTVRLMKQREMMLMLQI